MRARAVVSTATRQVALCDVEIGAVGEWDVMVELEQSAISVGTESYVLATGSFPRPYIPGYAPIGRVVEVGAEAARLFAPGERISYFQPRAPVAVVQNCGGHQSPAIINVNPPNATCWPAIPTASRRRRGSPPRARRSAASPPSPRSA